MILPPKTVRILWAVFVVLVGVAAVGLRFTRLEERPLHADEATHALILSRAMGPDGYRFDPKHFHGPTKTFFTAPIVRAFGQTTFTNYQKWTLRLMPATAGVLTVLVMFALSPWLGRAGASAAAVLVTVSPLLTYYSRMWIHETLLGLLAVSAVVVAARLMCGRWPWLLAAGILWGLMFASKATAVISFLAWTGAALFTWGWPRMSTVRRLLLGAVVAAGVAAWLYTDGGRYPGALVDVVRSFGVYQNDPGHNKPISYYFMLLVWPKYRGGFWWFETGIVVLAVVGVLRAWWTGPEGRWGRFLAWATFAHGAAYLLIAYKTPWLMVVPWLHVVMLAGYGAGWPFAVGAAWPWRAAMLGGLTLVTIHLTAQTCRACFRFASDDRNPYAYSPTSPDVEELSQLLTRLADAAPLVRESPVAVVGRGFWPLPWYLRQFPTVGYWPEMSEAVAGLPLVLAMPAQADAVAAGLRGEYFTLWRGLRHETPVTVFIRRDCWQRYLDRATP